MTDNRIGDAAAGDSADNGVGRVPGTEHTSTREFRVGLDELNKYAPQEGNSPLQDMLIDIAQRGRSLGVPLVVELPFPPWATRKEEVDTSGIDPFSGL